MNKSVPAEVLESDFGRLVTFLAVKPDVASIMAEWFTQMNAPNTESENWRANIEAQIQNHLKSQKNLIHLFKLNLVTQEEFDSDYSALDREIARLRSQLGEPQQVQEMFQMTAQSIQSVGQNWEQTSAEERESFVRSLFDEVVYDLDTRRIISFKLKSWAEPFLQLRVTFEELYRQQNASTDNSTGISRVCIAMPLWGFWFTSVYKASYASARLVRELYTGFPPSEPRNYDDQQNRSRNLRIRERYNSGQITIPQLAKEFGISVQRVHQILHGKRR